MVALLIRQPLTPVPPSHPHPIWSIRSACPIQQVSSNFIPLYQPAHKKSISTSKPKRTNMIQNRLWREHQKSSHNAAGEYNPPQYIPIYPNLLERTTIPRKTHPQLPQLPHHPDSFPHLLLILPHLIFDPPQRPLPPGICALPIMLNLLLPYLLQLEISPPPRSMFWPF